MVAQGRGGGGIHGHGAGARAHGLGDNLEFVGARAVVFLLVLHAAVVLEEELAGLLQHAAALADGTVGQRAGGYNDTNTHRAKAMVSHSFLRVLLKK